MMDIGTNKKVIMFQSTHISIVFDKWDPYILGVGYNKGPTCGNRWIFI